MTKPDGDGLLLGVDGGGTTTRAWLAVGSSMAGWTGPDVSGDADTPRILGRGLAGPGNVRAAGFEAAVANVALAVARAFEDARLSPTMVSAACMCLAGAGRAEEQGKITDWATAQGLARRCRVVHDGQALLAGGNTDWGIALISGTGSLAWGRDDAGNETRSGGWGYLIDDLGSGYKIGLSCLQCVVRAADGRGDPTALTEAVFERWKIESAADIVRLVYDGPAGRQRVSQLAEVVFDHPDDRQAKLIIQESTEALAIMAAAVASRLRFHQRGYRLVFGGGIFTHHPMLADAVVARLHQDRLGPQSFTLVPEPVLGAVRLAATL
jgi:N-acetylglucosamine kinase-like BadF-type ATPase